MENEKDYSYMQNRELSWLRFNERVLEEATDDIVPLLERLKFVSIFTSNLDEFFMVRVGSITDLQSADDNETDKRSGMTPSQQLKAIFNAVRPLYEKKAVIFNEIESKLRLHGIYHLAYDELEKNEKKFAKQYLHESIMPFLSPIIVDSHHPFPHLQNKRMYVFAHLQRKSRNFFGIIPISSFFPDVLFLPGTEVRYIQIEDIISNNLSEIFITYDIIASMSFCITRNADVDPNDESFDFGDDFREKMERVLAKRKRMAPVRLECSKQPSTLSLDFLCDHLHISKERVFFTETPMKMKYAFSLSEKIPGSKRNRLLYMPYHPVVPPRIKNDTSMISQIMKKDILLSCPYESMDPFIRLIHEAASDDTVVSIKITLYRVAKHAKLIDYLCMAAENGCEVTVLIELRARFDEQANIDCSERLENAGCTVIYGFQDYKVHSKVCLITFSEKHNVGFITQIGTGNYNEDTAKQYTDLCLMTANNSIGHDADTFFKNMAIGNLDGEYKHLIVSPCSLKQTIMECIDKEIRMGSEGKITIKINSFTDPDLIEKLKEASCASVNILLIIRGICCILPGINGKTENIEVRSIVGRYLEHSRIYCFGNGDNEKIYIASADFMTRNTERRVEVGCPIYDSDAREYIRHLIKLSINDSIKGRKLSSDGHYSKVNTNQHLDSQQYLMDETISNNVIICKEPEKKSFIQKIREIFSSKAS